MQVGAILSAILWRLVLAFRFVLFLGSYYAAFGFLVLWFLRRTRVLKTNPGPGSGLFTFFMFWYDLRSQALSVRYGTDVAESSWTQTGLRPPVTGPDEKPDRDETRCDSDEGTDDLENEKGITAFPGVYVGRTKRDLQLFNG